MFVANAAELNGSLTNQVYLRIATLVKFQASAMYQLRIFSFSIIQLL